MIKLIKTDNFSKVLKGTKLNKEKYEKLYKESIENTEEFWNKVAKRIDWKKPYENVKEVNFNDKISIKWFLKGELNVCYNCVDRHLQTKGNKIANQFIISTDNGMQYVQSYDSIIVKYEPSFNSDIKAKIVLDKTYWNYSVTTSKYRNKFLDETTKQTKEKIKSGQYILADLN